MIIGYLLGFIMGMTLGLLGAGGSILTVPILVYFFNIPPLTATGYSLVVVGAIALVGAWRYSRQQLVDLRSVAIFCLPSILTVILTRTWLIPSIPDPIFHIGQTTFSKDACVLILFGLLMLFSAYVMLKRAKLQIVSTEKNHHIVSLMACSALVGVITGLVGVGGGFLIMPTLTGLFKLPVKMSVGTSLAIIACNALSGFNSDLVVGLPFDWILLTKFLAITLVGMYVGTTLNKTVEATKLCRMFAFFTLIIGLGMIAESLYVYAF